MALTANGQKRFNRLGTQCLVCDRNLPKYSVSPYVTWDDSLLLVPTVSQPAINTEATNIAEAVRHAVRWAILLGMRVVQLAKLFRILHVSSERNVARMG
jgi:hypothetical protein